MADNKGTGGFFQVQKDDWAEVNRALRYLCNSVDTLSGRRGTVAIANDLDLNEHRAINAADPVSATDLVTKQYGDAHYIAASTTVNPGASSASSGGGSSSTLPFTSIPVADQRIARWDNTSTLGSGRVIDNDTYIIIGTGSTDAAVTSNALIVGSSANAGDLLVVLSGLNSEAIRLLPATTGNVIASDRTGAGTYRDLIVKTNNTEAVRFTTGQVTKLAGDLQAVGKISLYANAAPTDGQVLIGKTSTGTFEAATVTGGTGVTVTPGAGAVTVAIGQAVDAAANVTFNSVIANGGIGANGVDFNVVTLTSGNVILGPVAGFFVRMATRTAAAVPANFAGNYYFRIQDKATGADMYVPAMAASW